MNGQALEERPGPSLAFHLYEGLKKTGFEEQPWEVLDRPELSGMMRSRARISSV